MLDLSVKTDLSSVPTQLRTGKANLEQVVEEINGYINAATEAWQGKAAGAYQEQWGSLLPQFKQAEEVIQVLSDQVEAYVNALNELEETASGNYSAV